MSKHTKGNEIRFLIDRSCLPPGADTGEKNKLTAESWQLAFIKRIARIIDCSGEAIVNLASQKYLLGSSNDWWLRHGNRPNELVITYRYGLHPETQKKLSDLRDSIILLLDLDKFNPEGQNQKFDGKMLFISCFFIDPRHSLEQDYLPWLARILSWDGRFENAPNNGQFANAPDNLGYWIGRGKEYRKYDDSNWLLPASGLPNNVAIAGPCNNHEQLDKLCNTIVWLMGLEKFQPQE